MVLLFPALLAAQPGSLDTGFDPGAGFDEQVFSLAIQPDGKAVVGGRFTTFDGVSRRHICRLDEDGGLDTSFEVGTGFGMSNFTSVYALAIQPDGKIIAGGTFTTYNGASGIGHLVRLNEDGSIDPSFDTGTGFDGPVMSLSLGEDGRILAGGYFQTYDGDSASFIIRLNSDGSRDASFNTGAGFNSQVFRVLTDADGRVIVGGGFTTYDGVQRIRICRLWPDGTLDESFDPLLGFSSQVDHIVLQEDGKLVVGGIFTEFNGMPSPHLARLNTDGSHDAGFSIGSAADDLVRGLVVQPNGRIVVSGWFSEFNGVECGAIIRLEPDGSHDSSFSTGTGFDIDMRVMTLRADGRILCGGFFHAYNGVGRNFIAQLNGDGSVGTPEPEQPSGPDLFPNPAHATVNILGHAGLAGTVDLVDLNGRTVRSLSVPYDRPCTLDLSGLAPGLYGVHIIQADGSKAVKRLVVE